MTKYTFKVEVPKEGPLTREQGWAALDRLMTRMDLTLSRMEANYRYDESKCVVSKDEFNEAQNVRSRMRRLINMLGRDVLDQLAGINSDDTDDDDLYGINKFPPAIRFLIRNYSSDVRRYNTEKNGSMTVLAFALLEQDDWEPHEIGEIIRDKFEPDSKYSDWHSCPCCDEWEFGFIDKEPCDYCYGWGYVHGDKPDYDKFPESSKGRFAVSQGKEWTDEQEQEALAEEREE